MICSDRVVLAGWGLSFAKDSIGFAAFFGAFETVKSQGYYNFVRRWYGDYRPVLGELVHVGSQREDERQPIIKPHYAIEPSFLLLAGISASG